MDDKLMKYLNRQIEQVLIKINDDAGGDMELFLAGVVAFTAKFTTEAFRKGQAMNDARPME
jgi:hypothetical protein